MSIKRLRLSRIYPPDRRWLVVGLMMVAVAAWALLRLRNSDVVLLWPDGDAKWMRVDAPVRLRVNPLGERRAVFVTHLTSPSPRRAELSVQALRRVEVRLNGRAIFDSGADLTQWKRSWQVPLDLPAGQSELALVVTNLNGPAMAVARVPELNIASGPRWEATADGQAWSPAATADDVLRFEKPTAPPTGGSLLKLLPWLIPIGLAGAAWGWFQPRWLTPARICCGLLGLWAILAANNVSKLPARLGYDYNEHLRYIMYVANNHRLPLADEGWQMFQSPLYYLVSAPLLSALPAHPSELTLMGVLRIVPLLCGAAQVVLCYFAARYALPGRLPAQSMAVLLAGLLPMNLYISQNVGNEPMCGCFSALSIVLMLRYLRRPMARTDRSAAGAGAALGLALLSKVSAALLLPVMVWTVWARRGGTRRALILLASCSVVCGWYYIRNMMHFGRPFVAGWDPARFPWWQDPGYRTLPSFFRFGRALIDPLYAGMHGFWDSLYSTMWADGFVSGKINDASRPPWNYTLMSAGVLLALLPSLGIVAGIFVDLRNRCVRLAVVCLAVYMAALMDLYLSLPVYSTVKATYLLGLTPVLGLLFAAGVGPVLRARGSRAVMYGLVVVWAATSYGAFFVF